MSSFSSERSFSSAKKTEKKAPLLQKNGGSLFSRFSLLLKEHPYYFLWGITFLGMIFRFIVSFELLQNDPATTSPMKESDMATYIRIADGILQGKLPDTFYYQPFYYTVFLPLCRFAGSASGPAITAILQTLLGGGIIFFAGKCAMRTAGVFAGLAASILAAFSSILIYFTPYALLEILQAFFIILLFDLTVNSLGKPDWKKWTFAGLVLGLSMLTRGNTLFFLPLIVSALFLRKSPLFSIKKKLLYCGIFLFSCLLPQIPFAAYNTIKTGHLSGPSTAGGAVLALGNNPEAAPAGLEIPHTPSWQEWMKKEKEISIPVRILSYALKEPGAWVELKCKQFLLFWSQEDHPNNISEEYNAMKSSFMQKKFFLPSGVIAALALAGLFAGFYGKYYRRKKDFMLLAGFLFLYALSVTAFYILARFRLPVLPLMCVASGVFLGRLFRVHCMQSFLRMLLFLVCGIFICYGAYPLYAYTYEPVIMKKIQPGGICVELEDPDFPGAAHKNWNLSIMDASSMFQGGWGQMEIKEGMEITKIFTLPEGTVEVSAVSLVLPVSGNGGTFSVEVNGKSYAVTPQAGETGIANIPLSFVPYSLSFRGKEPQLYFTFRFYNVEGTNMIHFDNRRDYGRSFLEGKTVPCELALRLLLPLKK